MTQNTEASDPLLLSAADFREAMPNLEKKAIAHRRHLHRHPELSGQEHETTRYIADHLREMGIRLLDFDGPGVVAQIDAVPAEGPVVALRADIDALPVPEHGSKPTVSERAGVSHACGHDGHTAILLAVAEWVASHADRLRTSVRFIFQSSEEQIPSGAERLVRLGVLEGVDHIFGLHLWQEVEKGKVGVVEGPMMASTDDFDITLTGPGGHGAMPQDSIDLIVTAARLVTDLQTIVARKQDPLRPLVITTGHFEAHGNHNVLPARVLLQGTVRALDPETRDHAQRWITDATNASAAQSGAEVDLFYQRGTPPVINDPSAAAFIRTAAESHCHDAAVTTIRPVMGGEDFSFYLEQRPGAFAFVGMGGPVSQHAHHTPRFDIDEDVLMTGVELMVGIIDEYGREHG